MDEKFIYQKQQLSALVLEVENRKYQDICEQYAFLRRIRGDGNCFYRALAFGCLESFKNAKEMEAFAETVKRSPALLRAAGFDESRFKHLHNTFVSVLESSDADERQAVLLEHFNERTTSDSVVQYLRLLTSAYLQNHSDFFQDFVEAPSLKVYCTQEVETMAMECDHVEILALSEALGVSIRVVSIEGKNGGLMYTTIPDGTEASLHLLYEDSHYDLLYQACCADE